MKEINIRKYIKEGKLLGVLILLVLKLRISIIINYSSIILRGLYYLITSR